MMEELRIAWQPDFIEEAVFVTATYHTEAGDHELVRRFHEQKDAIYDRARKSQRNVAFQEFYEKQFLDLGLDTFFSDLLREFPCLRQQDLKFLGRRVWSRKEEGVELYVHGDVRNVIAKLQAIRMKNLGGLATYLRHELLHISDMLDPDFAYVPNAELGGNNEVEDNLIRDRFRVLWDLYVASRIKNWGHEILFSLRKHEALIDRAFSSWQPKEREKIVGDMLCGEPKTQGDLLGIASGRSTSQGTVHVAEKCSLCGFLSLDDMGDWTEGDVASVIDVIQKDRPDWDPAMKSCRQCFEMYRSKVGIGSL
jgi:predicted CopG family antitoxin